MTRQALYSGDGIWGGGRKIDGFKKKGGRNSGTDTRKFKPAGVKKRRGEWGKRGDYARRKGNQGRGAEGPSGRKRRDGETTYGKTDSDLAGNITKR